MSNLPSNRFTRSMGGMVKFWKSMREMSVAEIAAESERPVHLACIGSEDDFARLIERIGRETLSTGETIVRPDVRPYVGRYASAADAPSNSIVIDASVLNQGEPVLAQHLAQIVLVRPELCLTLARHIPAFRPAVATVLVNDASWQNARIALLSALPGIIPFTDFLLPATALGDMMLLTKNQILLLLKIAAAYGLPVDLRARTRELLPVVGGAFGWRAIARELIGLVPGGIGMIVKGAVAFAGTYTVGKAAQIYYSTGQSLPKPRLKRLYLDAYKVAGEKLKQAWRRGRSRSEVASAIVAGGGSTPISAGEVKVFGPSGVDIANQTPINGKITDTQIDKQVKLGV